MELIHSPDDGGYYFEMRDGTWETSQVFPTRSAAIAAYRFGGIVWHNHITRD